MDQREDLIYELIEGVVMMSPRPAIRHQEIYRDLLVELGMFFKGKSCSVLGEVEIEVGQNVLVPDIYVYCDKDKLGKQRYMGGPKIVVEILSPSTAFRDLNEKLRIYRDYGVEEYWIVSPTGEMVTVHCYENQTVKEYVKGQFITSDVIEGLHIELSLLF